MGGTRSSQWQALRSRYVASLEDRLKQLATAWHAYGNDPAAEVDKPVLLAVSHRLAGSGEAYGFSEITLHARCFEQALLDSTVNAEKLCEYYQNLIACLQTSRTQAELRPVSAPIRVEEVADPRHPTVVLAEDDPDFGGDMERVLRQQGFRVVWIERIAELPAAVARYKPLAAIIDMIFPEGRLAGAESILTLRQRSGPPLPVIFISGSSDFDIRLASVRAGGSHFFTKPVKNEQLVRTLRSLLGIEVSEPYRILMVDDDQTLLDLYRDVLQDSGFQVFCADNAVAGLECMHSHDPELVLLDINMPGCSGLELGQIIRQHEQFSSTPILFMSAETNSDVQMACVRLAGDEFITKPIEPWRLLMAVESRVKRSRVLRMQSQRMQGASHLEADHDLLTALPALRQLRHDVERRLAALGEGNGAFALLKVDLDDFHTINDVYGHTVGDHLLQRLAWVVSHQLSHDDLLCRDSGDEFWIVLAHAQDPAHIAHVVEAILTAIRQPFTFDDKVLSITASIGIALAPQDGRLTNTLLQCVDTALFHAKREPGGSYCYFASRMQEELVRHHTVEQELKTAVSARQFIVYYQPIFDMRSGGLCGFEALVRWQHPLRGIVGPQDFISIIEARGMARDLTRQVLESALQQLKRWHCHRPHLFMSVNLTAQDALDPNIANEIDELLQSHQIDAHSLVLELTESALISDWHIGGANLQSLSDLGVGLAIDDFGTGYSSLSYLNRFPVSKLKIDRSFVSNWSHRQDDRLIRAIVHLGCTLGFSVVAEGVEQPDQLAFLRALGCHEFQGYLVSKPLSAEQVELAPWFQAGRWQPDAA